MATAIVLLQKMNATVCASKRSNAQAVVRPTTSALPWTSFVMEKMIATMEAMK